MSDDFHRPTYTSSYTSSSVHKAFNATQVRLYGVPGLSGQHKKGASEFTAVSDKLIMSLITKVPVDEELQRINDGLTEAFKGFAREKFVQANASYVFIDTIVKEYMITLGAIDVSVRIPEKKRDKDLSAGVIFGYAYEGHTYDLPKPKIMLIPAPPQDIPPDDSGYDKKAGAGYKVWIVDKLDQCVEIEVNQGFVEQLVLDANLPGKRSPSMYAGKMLLGHRSGRLTE